MSEKNPIRISLRVKIAVLVNLVIAIVYLVYYA
jgi:hypothetical protein